MTSAVTIGETHRYLFTVSDAGRMRMIRDGVVLGELTGGYVPREAERTKLYVGGSSWPNDGLFQGVISELKLWRGTVEWGTAFPTPRRADEALEDVLPQAGADAGSGAAAQKQGEEETSERVAKLMAKKAERKARKAMERSQEATGPEVT